jgi:hypothetical protein
MTHCIQFYHKWKREGNYCGLRKQDAKDIDSYLSLVERISQTPTGLESDFVFDHFTAGAARPLIRCKDEDVKTKATNYVISCLKRGEDVTGGDLQATIEGFQGKVTHLREVKGPIEQAMYHAQKLVDDNKPILSLAQQQAEKHVNPGAAVMVNPVIINDTLRESPFKTGLQVQQHDKNPLGIIMKNGDTFTATIKDDKITIQDPAKVLREKRFQLADELMMTYSERTQMEIRDLIRISRNGEKNAADVFYFGVQALINPPKAPSSAGSAMRRP